MDLGGAENLVILMALAGDQHQIIRPGFGNRSGNGAGPISFHHQRRPGRNSRHHVVKNPLRIFRARVIRGDHHTIRQLGDHRGHLRALPPVPITAATEHAHQLALHERAGCQQGIAQAVGRVGVIHQHRREIGHRLI